MHDSLASTTGPLRVRRLAGNPIVGPATPGADERVGTNFNGPSLIRVPDWLPDPLGRYYLYFAHHHGQYIRLAYAEHIEGPWHIHPPGTLRREQTVFDHHIASPDVHVDDRNRRILMYYHGCCNRPSRWERLQSRLGLGDPAIPWRQYTCLATSPDGLRFTSDAEPRCQSYLRMFEWRGRHFGVAMPGQVYESDDGLTGFRPVADLRHELCYPHRYEDGVRKARHFATQVCGDTLRLFYSRTNDRPEHILLVTVALDGDPAAWRPTTPVSVLRPEHDWEGADCPLEASRAGDAHRRVHQVRDPAIYEEDGRTWLLYSVAGEAGIGIAEVTA